MPRSFALVPAAYLLLLREGRAAETEVLLQLRRNTGYMDGYWACGCAGHVEPGESAVETALREAREELGIVVDPDGMRAVTTVHRTDGTDRPIEQRVDMFFMAFRWRGEPYPREGEKNAGVEWFPLDRLPDRVPPHERHVIELLGRLGADRIPAIMTFGFRGGQTRKSVSPSAGTIERSASGHDPSRRPFHHA